jgi:hypothetical protein
MIWHFTCEILWKLHMWKHVFGTLHVTFRIWNHVKMCFWNTSCDILRENVILEHFTCDISLVKMCFWNTLQIWFWSFTYVFHVWSHCSAKVWPHLGFEHTTSGFEVCCPYCCTTKSVTFSYTFNNYNTSLRLAKEWHLHCYFSYQLFWLFSLHWLHWLISAIWGISVTLSNVGGHIILL